MRFQLAFVAGMFCACAGLSGQTPVDTLPDGRLAPVTVTAQFAPTDVRHTVNAVRILDRRTIENRAAVNLEELLLTEASIRLSQDPVLGNAVGINGLRGENVKILIDGVPVVGRLNGSVDPGQLPLDAVQQVEIIEGAQSLMYGSEASAGVINLVTRKSQLNPVEAEAGAQVESNGFRNLQARAGVRLGKFLLQLGGNRLDFQPAVDTALGRDQLWNPKTQTAGRAMLRFSPSEKFDLRLSGSLFSEKVDNLGELRRPQYKPYAFDDYYHTGRSDLALHSEGWLSGRWFWQATAGWNRFDRIKNSYRYESEGDSRTLIDGQQDTSAASGLLTRLTIASDRRERRWDFLLGLENYAETAEGVRIVDSAASRFGEARGNDLGLFGSVKSRFFDGKLTLQGGARWTQNRLYGAAITPSFWLLWRPAAPVRVRLSYANGFRSPGLKELYFNFIDVNHYLVGNTALAPERSDNLRAELDWQPSARGSSEVGFTLAGFYNDIRDRIILSEFAPVQYRYVNLERWQTRGGSAGFRIGWRKWLRLRSEVVLTGFFNPYSQENDALPPLNWSADWTNELTFLFFRQQGTVTVWHKRTGKTPYFFEQDNGVVQGESQAWHLLNVSAGGRFFKERIRCTAGVKNLLDVRMIRTGESGAAHTGGGELRPVHWGRTFFVSVNLALPGRTLR